MRSRLSRRLHLFLRGCAGTNMIEAAIIAPLLLLLTFSVVDFASIFYVYLALENGVSQGTRFAVTGNVSNDPVSGVALDRAGSIKLAVRNATPTLTLDDSAFTFNNMKPGGSTWAGGVGGPGDLEKVTVDYNWTVMTPLLRPFFPSGVFHFTVSSVMKNESFK